MEAPQKLLTLATPVAYWTVGTALKAVDLWYTCVMGAPTVPSALRWCKVPLLGRLKMFTPKNCLDVGSVTGRRMRRGWRLTTVAVRGMAGMDGGYAHADTVNVTVTGADTTPPWTMTKVKVSVPLTPVDVGR